MNDFVHIWQKESNMLLLEILIILIETILIEPSTAVPQGSVLGPLLSLTSINDPKYTILRDDTSIIQSRSSPQILSKQINTLKLTKSKQIKPEWLKLVLFRPKTLMIKTLNLKHKNTFSYLLNKMFGTITWWTQVKEWANVPIKTKTKLSYRHSQ